MKKGKILGLLAMSAALLTGCVDSMPELTAEESAIITECAAGLLLKYSPHYNYKVVSEKEVAAAKAAEQELLEAAAEEETETLPEDDEAPAETPAQTEEAEQEELPQEVVLPAEGTDLAAELGMDDVILRYRSFELCDSYPKGNSGFRVEAARGGKLLVIHFGLEGSAEEDIACDMAQYNIRMRVNINDDVSVAALGTERDPILLPDALPAYSDKIPAGETVDVVAIAKVADMTEEAVGTLTLGVSAAGGSCTVRLK